MSKLVTTSVVVPSADLGKALKEHANTFFDIKRVSKPHDVDGEQWFYIDIYVEEPSSLDGKQFLRIGAVTEVPASELSFSGFIAKALTAELNKPKGKKKGKKKKPT